MKNLTPQGRELLNQLVLVLILYFYGMLLGIFSYMLGGVFYFINCFLVIGIVITLGLIIKIVGGRKYERGY